MGNKRVEEFRAYLDAVSDMKSTKVGDAASYYMDAIDTKTASLLTHVSIMMAILSIFYATLSQHETVRSIVLLEILFYLLATLGCLRSIFLLSPRRKHAVDEMLNYRIGIVMSRHSAYLLSLRMTIIVTIAFIITIAFHFADLYIHRSA